MELVVVSLLLGLLLPVAVLWPLERLWPAQVGQPLWRSDSALDVAYGIGLPLLRGGLMALALLPALAFDYSPSEYLHSGFGPVGRQSGWLQALGFLVLFDLSAYWMHRFFHGRHLWKFHAVHHSSTRLDWLSTVRHHPVNDIAQRIAQSAPALLLGFAPATVAWCLPFLTFHSLLIHSNIDWGFGPLSRFIVSPAFHRWHHAAEAEGRDKNFAELCPLWDRVFGTFYWPVGRKPTRLGIDDDSFPTHLVGQIRYPFRSPPVQ